MLIFKLQSFDGVRRRCLPRFYKALEPGTEDDRMKGALWALNVPVFGMPFIDPSKNITLSCRYSKIRNFWYYKDTAGTFITTDPVLQNRRSRQTSLNTCSVANTTRRCPAPALEFPMITDRSQPSIQECVSAMADNCK